MLRDPLRHCDLPMLQKRLQASLLHQSCTDPCCSDDMVLHDSVVFLRSRGESPPQSRIYSHAEVCTARAAEQLVLEEPNLRLRFSEQALIRGFWLVKTTTVLSKCRQPRWPCHAKAMTPRIPGIISFSAPSWQPSSHLVAKGNSQGMGG